MSSQVTALRTNTEGRLRLIPGRRRRTHLWPGSAEHRGPRSAPTPPNSRLL